MERGVLLLRELWGHSSDGDGPEGSLGKTVTGRGRAAPRPRGGEARVEREDGVSGGWLRPTQ